MNKLPQVEVLSALSTSFTTEVRQLTADAKALSQSYADLTGRMLKFAERITKLWEKAAQLDSDTENGQHQAHFRKAFGQLLNTDNPSIWSRWVTIGKHAKDLLPYKSALPPQRDSLYAVALASKEGKPLEQWIGKGKITRETTMREVQSLCRKKKRSAAADAQRYVTVTVMLDATYGEAAQLFRPLLDSPHVVKIKSHKSFHEAMKAALGPENYDALKAKAA